MLEEVKLIRNICSKSVNVKRNVLFIRRKICSSNVEDIVLVEDKGIEKEVFIVREFLKW